MQMAEKQMKTSLTTEQGRLAWRSPSNIALVKYWGKVGHQIPANPSISFTLKNAHTNTEFIYKKKETPNESINIDFYFEGEHKPDFAAKIEKFLTSLSKVEMPFLTDYNFEIRSDNSFPHSSGIASSASSMSALALCLCDMELAIQEKEKDELSYRKRASHIARLGSGSAARSVYGGLAAWGETKAIEGTDNTFALPFEEADEVFHSFYDAILIISEGEKAVSSRAGHGLMNNNPFAAPRYAQANENMLLLTEALKKGDLATFGEIVEQEALALHALMMVSKPSYVLFKAETWHIIEAIRTFRAETGYHLYFTLDAGPNVHMLYPAAIKAEVETFINEKLVVFLQNGRWIADQVGEGPERML